MATILKYPYNHTAFKLLALSMENEKNNFKLKLLNHSTPATAFDATHTQLSQVDNSGANEVYGFDWPQTGKSLTNGSMSIVNTKEVSLLFDNIYQNIAGGDLGPITSAVFYLDEGGLGNTLSPILFLDFQESRTVFNGYPFQLKLSEIGLFRFGFSYLLQ